MLCGFRLLIVQISLPEGQDAHDLGVALIELLQADDDREHEEHEDADGREEDGVHLAANARDDREVREKAGEQRDGRDRAPENRPE